MTTAALVVPFHEGTDPARGRNWRWLQHRYREWPIIEATEGGTDEGWSKARAVNAAVSALLDTQYPAMVPDVLVIADADCVVPADALRRAVELAAGPARWSVPHGQVYRLTRRHTDVVLAGRVDVDPEPVGGKLERPAYFGMAGGGIVCVSREAWEIVGGYEPAFCGWGGEDVSFGWALETLVGPGVRVGASLWHLHHIEQDTFMSAAFERTQRLQGRYFAARGDRDAMLALIAERATVEATR